MYSVLLLDYIAYRTDLNVPLQLRLRGHAACNDAKAMSRHDVLHIRGNRHPHPTDLLIACQINMTFRYRVSSYRLLDVVFHRAVRRGCRVNRLTATIRRNVRKPSITPLPTSVRFARPSVEKTANAQQ